MERLTYFEGRWHEGDPYLMKASTHGAWLGSVVFDGARHFDGMAPDMDRHCARAINSANELGLAPDISAGNIEQLVHDGARRFADGAAIYVRPMFWAEEGFIAPEPESTRFALVMWVAPLPSADGFSACITGHRRPVAAAAPTLAKASCHYPNLGLAMKEAKRRGYFASVVLDAMGNIAEFAFANLFMAKDGEVHTPVSNGTFLNGITRQRVIKLLRDDGITVHERVIAPGELNDADEIFNSGNYGKVMPCTRFEDRDLQPGPMFRRARELYWDFSATSR